MQVFIKLKLDKEMGTYVDYGCCELACRSCK